MLTGELRNQIDRIWDAFWSGGISNPLEVIEQITYLLFLRRLDDLHTLEENKSARLKKPKERRVFPEGKDAKKRPYEDFRWSRFKHFAPAEMYTVVGDHVFPFLRTLGGNGSTYAQHMKDARFTVPTPALLAKLERLGNINLARIDWAIVGGESGPGARPMEKAWVVEIRDQCLANGIPFFFKQWGGINKKRAGRLLDGRTWDGLPGVVTPAPVSGLPPFAITSPSIGTFARTSAPTSASS
jgi:hypothetical protein